MSGTREKRKHNQTGADQNDTESPQDRQVKKRFIEDSDHTDDFDTPILDAQPDVPQAAKSVRAARRPEVKKKKPPALFGAIMEAEAQFNSPESLRARRTTLESTWLGEREPKEHQYDVNRPYKDWYIKPVERGPQQYQREKNWERRLDEWELDLQKCEQLKRYSIIDRCLDPLDAQRKPRPSTEVGSKKHIAALTKLHDLIKQYKYEEEEWSDEEEAREKANPKYKRPPNRFKIFLAAHKKLLEKLPPLENEDEDEDEDDPDEEKKNEKKQAVASYPGKPFDNSW